MNPYSFCEDSWCILEGEDIFLTLPETMPDWVARQIVDLLNDDFRERIQETLLDHAHTNRMKLRFNGLN